MKKRLLSAALALAMVLTLLPVSVFAAAPATTAAGDGTETATYVPKNSNTLGVDGVDDAPGWYAQVKGTNDTATGGTNNASEVRYVKITSGFIVSGKYYSSFPMKKDASGNDTTTPLSTSFTSIGTASATMGDATTVNADVYSGTLSITGNALTSITVNDSEYTSEGKAQDARSKVSLPSGWPTVTDKAFSLTLTNVTTTSAVDGRSQTAAVAGTIKLTNAEMGNITLAGTVDTKTAAQTVSLTGGSKSGDIVITGGTTSNKVTVANSEAGSVTMISAGGSIEVSGESKTDDITVSSGSSEKKAVAVPAVRVTGGAVGAITRDTGDLSTTASSFTISGGNTSAGAISTANGSVAVTSAKTTTIAVDNGSVTIAGPTANTGVITAGSGSAGTVSVKVTGSNNVIGGITNTAATLAVDLPADPTNNYGTITDANNKYNGHNVKGGTFAAAVPTGWLANSGAGALVYQLSKTGEVTYYNASQLGTALTAQKLSSGTLTFVGSGNSPKQTITFKNGEVEWGELQSDGYTPIILPTEVAGVTVTSWFDGTTTFPAGSSYTTAVGTSASVELNAQELSDNVSKLTNVSAGSSAVDKSVYVSLSGNVITVSGGVDTANQSGGSIPIEIDLFTDISPNTAVDSVIVVYNPSNGDLTFAAGQSLGHGMTLEASGTKGLDTLRLSNGTKYTLNGTGIKVLAGELDIDDTSTEVVVTARVSGFTNDQNTALANQLMGSGADVAKFDWSDSSLLAQAVNAAAATISANQITTWINTAQRNAWLAKNTGTVPSDVATQVGGFSQVTLIPYLAVNVTAYNANGTMTATLVPSYRVVVEAPSTGDYADVFKGKTNGDADGNYVVVTGRALGSLSGKLGEVELTLKFPTGSKLATAYMHQDSTYVYEGTGGVFTITHGSTNGLGTVVLNTTAPVVTLQPATSNGGQAPAPSYYDTLQAAVDDAEEDGEITVALGYTGSTVISVTGVARKFTITTQGNHNITSNASGVVVERDSTGKVFTVQLLKDTAAAGQNIVVASATGGSASVSANPATAGQSVTVTLTPATGYVSQGVAVKTNTGATVTASGSGNTYTFTMPSNVTTVTVTPTFAVGDNKAVFAVNSSIQGTAAALTGTSDGKAAQGANVPVVVSPKSGYRTIGLTARGNNGTTADVKRTGTNNFNVTVPSGATTVTVTPSFDIDTGTPFIDVLSNHWASSYVTWAYNNKYIEGTGDYTYSPSNYMTIGEVASMLYKAAGSPSIAGMRNPYSNLTPTSHWAYDAIIWAANQGLLDTSTGTINGFANATRAQIVEILYRRAGSPAVYGSSGFTDVASNASYAKAVTWARQKGLSNGYGSNSIFRPGYAVSRAEMAAFLQRAFSKVG